MSDAVRMGRGRAGAALKMAAMLVMVCAWGGCESKVSIENYDLIANDMTEQQVEDILGAGEEDESTGGFSMTAGGIPSGTAPGDRKVLVWKDEGAEIIVEFEKGRVVNKRQKGL